MIRFILAFFISASICLGASFPISNGVLTTPLNANSQQINNLADPTSAQDAATKNWSLTNLQPLIANLPIFAPGTITMGNGDVLTVGSSGTVTTLGNITNSANGLLKLDGSGFAPLSTLPASVTIQGNTTNAASGLVKADANNIIPYDKGTIGLTGCAFTFEGDSITFGYGLPTPSSQCFEALFAADKFALNHGTTRNTAVSGSWIAAGSNAGNNITDRFLTGPYPHRPTANGGDGGPQSWLIVGAGINDLRGAGGGTPQTDTQIISALTTYTTAALADGFTVVLEDILPGSALSAQQETYRLNINKAIRTGQIPCSFVWNREYVLPDYSDGIYFQDGTHPTVEGHKLLEEDLESKMQTGAFPVFSGSVFYSSPAVTTNHIWNNITLDTTLATAGPVIDLRSAGVSRWQVGEQGSGNNWNFYISDDGAYLAFVVTGLGSSGAGYGAQLYGNIFTCYAAAATGQVGVDYKSAGVDRWEVVNDDANAHRLLFWDKGNGNTAMFLTGWNTNVYTLNIQGNLQINQYANTSLAGVDCRSAGAARWFAGSDAAGNAYRYILYDESNGNVGAWLSGWNTSTYTWNVKGSLNQSTIISGIPYADSGGTLSAAATANQVAAVLTGTTGTLNLTGATVTVATQTAGNNTTAPASTAFTTTAIANAIALIQPSLSASTATAGAGAGTGASAPTITILKTGYHVSLTTGTLPTLSATVFTISFNATLSSAPIVSMTPTNANASALSGVTMVFPSSSTTAITVTAGTTALAATTTYTWDISVGL